MSVPVRGARLRPSDRLRSSLEFDAAYSRGARVPSRSFTLIVLPARGENSRLGVTISRKAGSAVVRNAIRRRLREIFRRNRDRIEPPLDIVVHVKPGASGADYATLESEWLGALLKHKRARQRTT